MAAESRDGLEVARDHADLLRRAVEWEEKHGSEPHTLGMEWSDLRAHPATLNKLVVAGVLKVSFRSNSTTAYRLVDPEAVRSLLALAENPLPEPSGGPALPEDLFAPVVGYDDLKAEMRLSLEGEPVHFLLIGPPATAKSLFLMELARLPGAHFATGGSSSKAGINRLLLARRPRVLIVDEAEKMEMTDHSALLSLMEGGIVSSTKVGMTETVRITCSVFAACNSTRGLPGELLSRFERVTLRSYTEEEFRHVAVKLLTMREGTPEDVARRVADLCVENRWEDVRDAVRLARMGRGGLDGVERAARFRLKYRGRGG